MTSHDDIYRKIRTNHRKARERDRKLDGRLALMSQKVKVLYIQISTLGLLLVGDILSHYLGK